MHRAVDPSSARRIVLTAQETTCPICEGSLSIRQHRERYVWRLDGLVHQVCRDKRCLRQECAGSGTIYRPLVDLRLALPRMSFGLDVVVTVGERHLDRGESLSQIGRDLTEKGVPIHQTHGGELLRTFVVLCQMARGDQDQVKQRLRQQGGIYLMVDGVQFDDRSPVLYLCWDARSGTPLFGERLAARDAPALSELLRRVKRLGVPVRGVITDAEKGLVPAVAAVFPEVPHQLCHTHFLKNCARPLEEDLRRLGASVEQRAERVRKLERRLAKEAAPAVPAPSGAAPCAAEPVAEQEVARTLCALVKPQAKSSGKAPLAPPELLRHQRLEQVRKTVEAAAQKKTRTARPCPPPASMRSRRPLRSTGIRSASPAGSSDTCSTSET
jgi:hypothetical protein